jgi:thiol-disulfide isomerase/thioredoxin
MLNYILLLLAGCPAKLDFENNSLSTDSVSKIADEPPSQLGIINTDNCDQKAIGSTVCNMVFYDQNKEVWELYDHEGKVIILDFSTVWCGPCQNAGHYVQPIQDDYAGLIEFVTVLVDGATGDPPTETEINEWATSHSVTTAPVLYADRSVLDQTGETGYLVGGFPTYVFIDKELKIHSGAVGFNEQHMRSIIEELK